MEPRASRPAVTAALPAIGTLVGAALYGYVLTTVNLPEQWGYWLGGAAVLGCVIGRWYAILGALATLVLPLETGAGTGEVTALAFFVYLPGASLGIAVGVGLRRAIQTLSRRLERV